MPTSLEITLWSSLVFNRCVLVDSGLRVERSLSPPLRILDPPKVVDCPTRLFYIWIFIWEYTNLRNTAGQSAKGDPQVEVHPKVLVLPSTSSGLILASRAQASSSCYYMSW